VCLWLQWGETTDESKHNFDGEPLEKSHIKAEERVRGITLRWNLGKYVVMMGDGYFEIGCDHFLHNPFKFTHIMRCLTITAANTASSVTYNPIHPPFNYFT
jgi:hypothetical protein